MISKIFPKISLATVLAASATITALGMSSAPAQAYNIFFQEDVNNAPVNDVPPLPSFPNATQAQTNFLSQLTVTPIENFESFTAFQPSPLNLIFPGAGTATLNGAGQILNYPTNGTYATSGKNYWSTNSGNDGFKIDFDEAIAAFGFFATDIGDFGARLVLELGLVNGGTTQIEVNHTLGSSASTSGSVFYQGIIASNPNELFKSVRFLSKGSTFGGFVDGFGFDDMTIASADQVKSVPEPQNILGLATVLGLGVVFTKRRSLKSLTNG
jgi:hypothetical protein